MRMTHFDKLEKMHKHMAALGIRHSTYAPPAWRILWRMGIKVPPPLFAPFWPCAILLSGYFVVAWGLFMWLFAWSHRDMPLWLMLSSALFAGLLFGLCMAAYYRHVAHKHNLPAWPDYTGQEP